MAKLITIIVFLLLCKCLFCQNRTDTTTGRDILENSKLFFKILNAFSKLEITSDNLSKVERQKLFYYSRARKDIANFTVSFCYLIPVQSLQTYFSGSVLSVKKGKKPFLNRCHFTFNPSNDYTVCDSSFYYFLKKNDLIIDTFLSWNLNPCTYTMLAIDQHEKDYLSSIVPSTYLGNLLNEYADSYSGIETIINPRFDLRNSEKQKKIAYSPILKKLFLEGNYLGMKKLLYTQNNIFNWFIAEGLNYYNKKKKFLNTKTLNKVLSYNNVKYFKAFRDDKQLDRFYLSPSGARLYD